MNIMYEERKIKDYIYYFIYIKFRKIPNLLFLKSNVALMLHEGDGKK
jgi:hypothetical protein